MPKYIDQIVAEQIARSEMSRKMSERYLGVSEIPADKPRIITISRQLGSGGRVIAQMLAEKTSWSLWDRELVDAIAEHAVLKRRIVEEFDERTISDIEALTRSVLGEPEVGGFMYGRELARAVLSIAKRGNAIIIGRGANFIVPRAMNVRVEATEEIRAKFVMQDESLTHDEATRKIQHVDRERKDFARRLFGKDVQDPKWYDLIIEMDCFTAAAAAEIIFTAAKTMFPELAETEKTAGHDKTAVR